MKLLAALCMYELICVKKSCYVTVLNYLCGFLCFPVGSPDVLLVCGPSVTQCVDHLWLDWNQCNLTAHLRGEVLEEIDLK